MADIPAKLVKELRDKTGAGFGDCKKALEATEGDLEKAAEWLRQKGITSAEKKSGKITAEGLVGSYIHTGGRVGVLVEVNCQTDFVARNSEFQALVKDIAMQIAACPNVEYVQAEDIPADVVEKEKAIEMGRDDLGNKPENVREKIVAGRIEKRLKELSLLEQPYIKDQSITVAEYVKQNIAGLGENIRVRRFVRFVMGEGIERQESDFAAEVAAQTGAATTAAAEPTPEPAAEMAAEPTPEPTPEPVADEAPAAETASEPVMESAVESVEAAVEAPEAVTAEEPAVEESAIEESAVEEPAAKSAEEPAKSAQKSTAGVPVVPTTKAKGKSDKKKKKK